VFADIGTVPEYVERLPACGYRLLGQFALPEDFWWVNYYALVEERIRGLRKKYVADPAAKELLDEEQREVDLYRQHARWYGSAFLVMQKSGDNRGPAG
jgi:hypothetical protein